MSTKRMFGQSDVVNQVSYHAGNFGLPTYNWAWEICVDNQSTVATNVSYQTQLTYYCKFYDRKQYNAD